MALNEQDREDLLRDGRAMPIRGETLVDSTVWLVGFRPQGQASLYAGPDLVFQFNADGALRRVYADGERLASENGRLQRLVTLHRGTRLQLVREPLTDQEQQAILDRLVRCREHCEELAKQSQTTWNTVGMSEQAFRTKLLSWLGSNGSAIPIAIAPSAQ